MKVTLQVAPHLTHNATWNPQTAKGVHMQTKAENDRHVKALEREFIAENKSKLPKIVGMAPAAKRARELQKRKLEADAHDYAVKNEPHRFLDFLARKTNGISADKELRVVNGQRATPSSSWIESISTGANGAPILVKVKGSSKTYACPCPWETAEQILKSDSVGREVAARLFNGRFKIGAAGTKNQGKILNRVNGRVAKIRGL